MIRYEADSDSWKQEHLTFFHWFIHFPGKVVKTSRRVTVRMSRHYYLSNKWRDFEQRVLIICWKTRGNTQKQHFKESVSKTGWENCVFKLNYSKLCLWINCSADKKECFPVFLTKKTNWLRNNQQVRSQKQNSLLNKNQFRNLGIEFILNIIK